MSETKLKVMEALQEEAYKGIVRVDSETMKQLEVHPGDVVEIEGNRATVGIVDRAYPTDVGQNIIRMDGILRRNAKTSIGENVKVRRADIKEAKSITIAPAQKGVMIRADSYLFKKALLGRTAITGDIVVPGGSTRRRRTMSDSPFFDDIFSMFEDFPGSFGFGSLRFMVVATIPKQAVIITENTEVILSPKSVDIQEEKVPEVTYEDVGGLSEEIKKIREMVELPLKHPEIFSKLGIEPPKGVLLHGPPGTGKTLLAKAVANEVEANFIVVNGPEVMSKFYGDTEKKIREIFENAEKQAPTIIFFDELDAIAPKREETYGELERRMVSQLLTAMDGLKSRGKVIVIGASVTGDTPILIKDEEGSKLIKIKDFIDPYYGDEEENFEINVENKFALGFDSLKQKRNFPFIRFGNSDFKKIRSVFRHKIKEIYEIEYLGGKIKATGNHSVFIRTKNGLIAKPVIELKPGDILVDLPYKVNSNMLRSHNFIENINLTLLVNNLELITSSYQSALNGHNTTLLAQATGKDASTINKWKNGISIPREFSNNYHNLLPQSVEVTLQLMRLFGYYAAEGYARKEIDFCFGSHESPLINDLQENMKGVFNVNPSRIIIKDNRANITYNIIPLANFFGKHCGKGAHNKHVPKFLFESPREYFLEFLKGYVLGDGHVTKDGKITAVSVSKQLILELNWLCRMHGIKSYIGKFIVKSGRKIKNQIINKETIAYKIGISKHNNPFLNKNNDAYYSKKARIKSIKVMPYNDYVYDLCGCENEAFFGGESPILLHNTNRPNSLDPALRRPGRFDREITISVPNKEGRLNILKIHSRNMPLAKDVSLDKIAEITHGFVGADIAALCKEAAINVLRRVLPDLKLGEKEEIPKEILEKLIVTDKDFREALKIVRPSALREVLIETPNVKWSDVGGSKEIQQELKEAIEWPLKHPDAFKRIGVKAPKGILLYGPPGTGKTLLAKAVASESESNFILVRGPELLNKFVGESEKGVRKIFEKARQASPSIIFFDEIDSLAPRRGLSGDSQVTERVVNTLLSEMDGLEELNDIVVIAATNRPDMIDPALLRPGRFDRLLFVGTPSKEERLEILKIHTKDMPLAKDVNLDKIAEKTEDYSGADLEAVAREAGLLTLRKDIKSKEVKLKFFDEALKKVKPSVSKELIEKYKSIEENYLKQAKAAITKDIPSYLG